MGKIVRKEELFASKAVRSFDRTYRAIFTQAEEEVDRLQRLNGAMNQLENLLLNPDRIETMDVSQQVMLLDLLSRNRQIAIRNVMGFSTTLGQVRNLVALHDGIRKGSSLTAEDGMDTSSKLLEYEDDYE